MSLTKNSYFFSNKFKGFIWPGSVTFMSILLLIIGTGIGLLFTAQWRTQPKRATDPVISYSALIKTKESLVSEQEDLKNKIKKLNDESTTAQKELKNFSTSKNKVEEIEKLEDKIGLTKITGNGVVITLDDAKKEDANSQSISHAADLRDIINLLWGQGVKAISVNNERVVFNTSIDCIVNTILINATKTVPPFKIEAVGDADALEFVLNNPNYLADIHKRMSTDGLVFNVEKKDNIEIAPYSGSLKVEYAKLK